MTQDNLTLNAEAPMADALLNRRHINGVNPQRHFTDLLTRLVSGWPNSRIDELMPW
jgi:hypothetical protein